MMMGPKGMKMEKKEMALKMPEFLTARGKQEPKPKPKKGK